MSDFPWVPKHEKPAKAQEAVGISVKVVGGAKPLADSIEEQAARPVSPRKSRKRGKK